MDHLVKTKTRALKILGSRNLSEKEMIKRLTDKGESTQNAEEVVAWLVELGYIDDNDYATLIVRHYTSKGYGTARICDELYKRGIPKELWDEKLEAINESDTEDATLAFLNKKLKGSTEKDDLRRAQDALVRRGFSYSEAKSAINKYIEDIT